MLIVAVTLQGVKQMVLPIFASDSLEVLRSLQYHGGVESQSRGMLKSSK